MKQATVYIMTNKRNGTLYTGVTSNLIKRVWEHKRLEIKGFSSKYKTTMLVYFEQFEDILTAIEREKQIKSGSRSKKLVLIETSNPNWKDFYDEIIK